MEANEITIPIDNDSKLKGNLKLKIIQGASNLFEEPGKLDEVAKLAASWFTKHLS